MTKQNSYRFRRKRGDVHPQQAADLIPLHPFKPAYDGTNRACYDSLNDASSYSDYAWAFLRRNRFYQNSIDKTDPFLLDIEIWGHKPSALTPANCGLLEERKTPKRKYWENSTKGEAVQWEAIHGFFSDFSEQTRPIHRIFGSDTDSQRPPHLRKPHTLLPFVFDLDCLLGHDSTAIDVQLSIARAILQDHARRLREHLRPSEGLPEEESESEQLTGEKLMASCFENGKTPPKKEELRNLLRIADLLSPQYEGDPPENKKRDNRKLLWEMGDDKPSQENLVLKLPQSFSGRGNEKRKDVSDGVKDAYLMIYEWNLLKLLQFDNWGDHFYPSRKELSSKEQQEPRSNSSAPSED